MLNAVHIQGRFCAQPELHKTETGLSVCSFTLANDQNFGEKKATYFLPFVAWKETAEFICKWFNKGDPVCISGRLQSHKKTTKDGRQVTELEIRVEHVDFCGRRENQQPAEEKFVELDDEDYLPF